MAFERPNIFKLLGQQNDVLTFETALDLLLYHLPDGQLFMRQMGAPLLDSTFGQYTSVLDARGTWKPTKKKLNQFSTYDVCVDRQTIRYKMFFMDLSGKYIKTRKLAIPLNQLTVGQFHSFITEQLTHSN